MFAIDMGDKQVMSSELVAINWDFETVTTSDASGEFIIDDTTSGSSDTRYGWIDNVSRVENRGLGTAPVSTHQYKETKLSLQTKNNYQKLF